MANVTINDLMKLEKELLMIKEEKMFELSITDYLKLETFLKDIGRITNTYFFLQNEFYKRYGDKDKLKEYHDRILNDEFEYNTKEITEFIEYCNGKNKEYFKVT